jgi:metal-sulfur cluster biosynthetic enzyme
MVLTTDWCPFVSRLPEMVTEEVGAVPTVDNVDVVVILDPTQTGERVSESAREHLRLPFEELKLLREARLRAERSQCLGRDSRGR